MTDRIEVVKLTSGMCMSRITKDIEPANVAMQDLFCVDSLKY